MEVTGFVLLPAACCPSSDVSRLVRSAVGEGFVAEAKIGGTSLQRAKMK